MNADYQEDGRSIRHDPASNDDRFLSLIYILYFVIKIADVTVHKIKLSYTIFPDILPTSKLQQPRLFLVRLEQRREILLILCCVCVLLVLLAVTCHEQINRFWSTLLINCELVDRKICGSILKQVKMDSVDGVDLILTQLGMGPWNYLFILAALLVPAILPVFLVGCEFINPQPVFTCNLPNNNTFSYNGPSTPLAVSWAPSYQPSPPTGESLP
ncbi:uncharacterized protein LOC121860227 [Homarus americanus]|uniref:uncharacterized protein LOC121860227 n=1 Tax=Homarus americanus TaxID=6706 RepID=UPI001C491CAD|nr:uncharacterized protein LOC121860227 [Homarus americanus]